MNLGLRCGQMIAGKLSRMNIVERSAWFRPLENEEESEPEPKVIVHRYSDMSKEEYNLLQQTSRKVSYLENVLKEHLAEKKSTYTISK